MWSVWWQSYPGGCIQWQWLGIFVFKTMADCDGGSGDLNIPVETVAVSQLIVILTILPKHPHNLTTFHWSLSAYLRVRQPRSQPSSLIDVEVVDKFYDFCGVKCIKAPGPDTMVVVSLSKLCLKYLD